MRITITIDDALHAEAKVIAARSGQTLGAVVEDALRVAIAQRPTAANRPQVVLPTYSGGRLQPDINLDSNSGLLDLMDETSG